MCTYTSALPVPVCSPLVTEYVPGGELWNQTHKTGMRHSLSAFYAAELLDALEYLHANNVRGLFAPRAPCRRPIVRPYRTWPPLFAQLWCTHVPCRALKD